jgi:hypothetical protein
LSWRHAPIVGRTADRTKAIDADTYQDLQEVNLAHDLVGPSSYPELVTGASGSAIAGGVVETRFLSAAAKVVGISILLPGHCYKIFPLHDLMNCHME